MALNVFRFVTIFTAITFCGLGLFVYSRNFSSRLNGSLCAFLVVVGLWSFGFFLTMFEWFPYEWALIFSRASHFFGGLTGITYLAFVVLFLQPERKVKVQSFHYYFAFLNSLGCFTPWMIKELPRKLFFPYYPEAGILYPFYIINFVTPFALAYFRLFQAYRDSNLALLKRKQVVLALAGVLIGWSGVGTLFLLIYNVQITPALILLPAVFIVFTYSIIRYRFLDIEVIVKRTLRFAGLVGFAVFFMAIVPKYMLELFGIPRVAADLGGAVIVALFFGRVRQWLIDVTDRYLFQKKYDFRELMKGFADELTTVLDLKRLVHMTMETLTEKVKLENCSLLLLNRDTRKYEVIGSKGTNGKQVVLDEQEPFITFLRETHEPIVLKGPKAKVRYPDTIIGRVWELGALVCLPLHIHEDLIGVLCLGKKKSDEDFTKDDLDDLLALGKTLSVGITNAQQLDELTKTQAKAAQSEKLAVIGTLSAGINHEICNPLGIVKAQCEAFLLDLEDGILIGKSSQELLDRISTVMRVALKQIDRATAITQKLSNFAKPAKEPNAQPVSVGQEIDEVLLLVGHDLKLEKVEVVKDVQLDLPPIVVDRRQLQEVLFNIIRNAGQAITPPGMITIRAHEQDRQVRIEIADTGSGIPADKLEKIYDPFFTTKEPGRGTGLGLFIVRQIVERNKGRISVESTVGKGTTFYLDFPVASEAHAVAR